MLTGMGSWLDTINHIIKKKILLFPSNQQLPVDLQKGWKLLRSSFNHDGNLSDFLLCRESQIL